MTRHAPSLGIVGMALLLAVGCGTTTRPSRDFVRTQARLFLESTDGDAPMVRLPRSGVAIAVSPKAVITEGDIVNAEVVQVDLGRCLMLEVTPAASRDLYRLTGSNQGRRLVLTLNDVALGVRQIDRAIEGGALLLFVEITDAELATLVVNLKRTSEELQKEFARR